MQSPRPAECLVRVFLSVPAFTLLALVAVLASPLLGTSPANPGDPHIEDRRGETDKNKEDTDGDPVSMFSGAFLYSKADMKAVGRGMDFVLKRTYNSGALSLVSPMGRLWSLNWDRKIRVYVYDPQGGASWWQGTQYDAFYDDGTGRLDKFALLSGKWYPESGYFSQLVSDQTLPSAKPTTFELRDSRGLISTFTETEAGCAQNPWITYRLSKVTDRAGNSFQLFYENDGVTVPFCGYESKRIKYILDTLGRKFTFDYDTAGWLESVTDFAGRSVVYEHDSLGNLTAVEKPEVLGTAGITDNDFSGANRKRTEFTYAPVDLIIPNSGHRLLTIIAPNQVADGTRTPYLQNTYSASVFFRVVRQRLGGLNSSGVEAGGTYDFLYEFDDTDYGWFVAVRRTLRIDPNGNCQLTYYGNEGPRLIFDLTGRIDATMIDPASPPLIDAIVTASPSQPPSGSLNASFPGYLAPLSSHYSAGSPIMGSTAYITEVDHNPNNGLRSEVRTPDTITQYTYDDASLDPCQRANLLRFRRVDITNTGNSIEEVYAYEPIYNQACAVYGPRGLELGTPDRYSLVKIFDYQESDLSDGGNPVVAYANQWGIDLSQSSMLSFLSSQGINLVPITTPGIRSNLGDLNGDTLTDQVAGNCIKDETFVSVFDDPAAGDATTLTTITATRNFNPFSMVTQEVDGESNVTTYEYYAENDPDGNGVLTPNPGIPGYVPTLDGTSGTDGGGFLHRALLPTNVATPAVLEYEYDLLGRKTVERNGRGVSLGFQTTRVYNELHQLVRVTDARGYQRSRVYDANNNVVEVWVTDATPDFDSFLRPTGGETISSNPIVTRLAHDILDRVVELEVPIDSAGEVLVTRTRYDRNGNSVLTLSPEWAPGSENLTSIVYDELNRPIASSRGGVSTEFLSAFCSVANVDVLTALAGQISTRPADVSVSRTYFEDSRVFREEDGGGHPTDYFYDGFNRLFLQLDADGNYRINTWDAASQLEEIEVFDSSNEKLLHMKFRIDEIGRLVQEDSEILIDGSPMPTDGPLTPGDSFVTTRYLHNACHRIKKEVNDNRNSTRYLYDGENRQIRATDAVGDYREETYDANGNVVFSQEFEISSDTRYGETYLTYNTYDELDRLIYQTSSVGETFRYLHDSRNNLVFFSDAKGPVTEAWSSIDTLNEFPGQYPPQSINDHGNTMLFTYDKADRQLTTEKHLRAGGMGGNPIVETIVLESVWDLNSRLTQQVDGKGFATLYEYDDLDRPVAIEYADGTRNETLEHSPDHLPKLVLDENGSQIDLGYDVLDRLTSRTITRAVDVGGTTAEIYQYDGLGRLTSAEDDDSRVVRHYDSLGRVLQEDLDLLGDPFPEASTFATYDGVGNLKNCTYPGSRTLTMTHDSLERLDTISDSGELIADYSFLGPHRVDEKVLGNNTVTTFGYSPSRRIETTTHHSIPLSQDFDVRTATWDRMGNRLSRSDGTVTTSYEYDSIYRMIESDRTGLNPRTVIFDLDAAGNRDSVGGGLAGGDYVLGSQGSSVHQYSQTPFDYRFHDDNGNTIHARQLSPPFYYSQGGGVGGQAVPLKVPPHIFYDYRDQMVRFVDSSAGQTHTYDYDVLGRRIRKTIDVQGAAQETRYFYFGNRVIEERDGTNATQATYAYGRYIDEVLAMDRSGSRIFYHTDDQYNVIHLTDESGANLLEAYDYDDYGLPLDPSQNPIPGSTFNNPYLFNGRRFDPETGWYYYRARYFDPDAGRFTTRDPIGVWGDGQNLGNGYIYAGNNPWSRVDPSGLSQDEWTHEGTVIIGGQEMDVWTGVEEGFWWWSKDKRVTEYSFSDDDGNLHTFEVKGGMKLDLDLSSLELPQTTIDAIGEVFGNGDGKLLKISNALKTFSAGLTVIKSVASALDPDMEIKFLEAYEDAISGATSKLTGSEAMGVKLAEVLTELSGGVLNAKTTADQVTSIIGKLKREGLIDKKAAGQLIKAIRKRIKEIREEQKKKKAEEKNKKNSEEEELATAEGAPETSCETADDDSQPDPNRQDDPMCGLPMPEGGAGGGCGGGGSSPSGGTGLPGAGAGFGGSKGFSPKIPQAQGAAVSAVMNEALKMFQRNRGQSFGAPRALPTVAKSGFMHQ